ncbi:MAG: TldD/PmbA family protein [Firmicutes bacterium]|nr:TldD/PmbA family protein [Bacillota bacterium]
MNFDDFQKTVVKEAAAAGLKDYDLYYAESESTDTSVFNGEIAGFTSDREGGACFRCIVNGKLGYCSTELFTEEEANRIVSKAIENASTIETDNEPVIFKGSDSYAQVEPAQVQEVDMRKFAMDLYQKVLAVDPRVQPSSECTVMQAGGRIHMVNSYGLSLSNTYTLQGLMQQAIIREGEEQYDSHKTCFEPFDQMDTDSFAAEAVNDAIDKIGGGPVETGKYPVVLDAKAFSSLLSAFFPIFSAKAAQQGMSLLAGKEGQQIASPIVTIIDDPMYPDSPAKAPFDAEGVATRCKMVVENGVFKTLLYNLETAKKAGVESTGNASKMSYAAPVNISPFTFYLKPGEISKEDLYKQVGNGLIITSLSGLHAGLNAITGDFSLLANGYRITDGEKAGYVNRITVSGNFFDLIQKIETIGSDLDFGFPRGFSRIGSPSVYVPELSVAGK